MKSNTSYSQHRDKKHKSTKKYWFIANKYMLNPIFYGLRKRAFGLSLSVFHNTTPYTAREDEAWDKRNVAAALHCPLHLLILHTHFFFMCICETRKRIQCKKRCYHLSAQSL